MTFRKSSKVSQVPPAFDEVLLNALTRDCLLPLCSPATLVHISCVCRSLNAAVSSYITRTYDINKLLGRFFEDHLAFRSLQALTGTLISGPTALQFFDKATHIERDLEVYVKLGNSKIVGAWLVYEAGYEFQQNGVSAASSAGTSFAEALERAQIGEPDGLPCRDSGGLIGVFDFVKPAFGYLGDSKGQLPRVRVVVASETPMQLILKSPSSEFSIQLQYLLG